MSDLLRTYDHHGRLTAWCGEACRASKATLCFCICQGRAHNRQYYRAVENVAQHLTDILRVLKILGHHRVDVHPDVLAARKRDGLPPPTWPHQVLRNT